jgi:hypothetical protein
MYDMKSMADPTTETTTIRVISFLENIPEGKLTNFVHKNSYLPISAFKTT